MLFSFWQNFTFLDFFHVPSDPSYCVFHMKSCPSLLHFVPLSLLGAQWWAGCGIKLVVNQGVRHSFDQGCWWSRTCIALSSVSSPHGPSPQPTCSPSAPLTWDMPGCRGWSWESSLQGWDRKMRCKPFRVQTVILVCMMVCTESRQTLRARSFETDRSQHWSGPQGSPRRAV